MSDSTIQSPHTPLPFLSSCGPSRKQSKFPPGVIVNSFTTPQILSVYHALNTVGFWGVGIGYGLCLQGTPSHGGGGGDKGQASPCCWNSKLQPQPTLFFSYPQLDTCRLQIGLYRCKGNKDKQNVVLKCKNLMVKWDPDANSYNNRWNMTRIVKGMEWG